MKKLDLLISGYRSFKAEQFERNQALYRKLVREGQKPKVCMVACADSRVDPAIVLNTEPGEVFMVRNVANLVPPYEEQGMYHGVSAALEYAVTVLEVEDIVILGHAHCGGIGALIKAGNDEPADDTFITPWMTIAKKALARADKRFPGLTGEERARKCERAAVLESIDNLMTFPFIKERVEAGKLRLNGWHYDLVEGLLCSYNSDADTFEPV